MMIGAVMMEQDKRIGTSSSAGATRWAIKRPGRCKYCPSEASKILSILLLLLLLSTPVVLANGDHGREGPPSAATCLISGPGGAPFGRLKPLADETLAQEISAMSSHASVVLKHMLAPMTSATAAPNASKHQQPLVALQVGFESICDGWCNGFRRASKSQNGYWTYDAARGALVAKHIYQDAQEVRAGMVELRSARLLSPMFEAPPAYHSWHDTPLRGACKLSFRYYHTSSSIQFDVNIIKPKSRQASLPSSCDQRFRLLDTWSGNDQVLFHRAKSEHTSSLEAALLLTSTSQSTGTGNEPEHSVWQTVVLGLPETLNTSYAIEFFTFGSQVQANIDQPIGDHYLHGVALANITLWPECFGLNVNQTEAERVRALAEARSYAESSWRDRLKEYLTEMWHHHWLFILACCALLLCLIVAIVLYLCCSYVEALKTATNIKIQEGENRRQGKSSRCGLYWWLHWPPTGRSRVYAGGNGYQAGSSGRTRQQQLQLQLRNQQENLRQFLQPLRAPLEGIEMAENPGYLGKQHQHQNQHQNHSSAAVYQNTTAPAVNGNLQHSPTSGNNRKSMDLMMQQNDVERACDTILQPYYIDRSRLTITEELGNGAFGRVYQGCLICYCDNTTSDTCGADTHSIKVAVKTLTDQRMGRREFVQEAANMALVSHRNIVELMGVCFERQPMFIVMELLTGGNLKDFLIRNRDHFERAGSGPLWKRSGSLLSLAGGGSGQCQLDSYSLLHSTGGQPSPLGSHGPPTQSGRLCMGDLLVFGLDVARACDYLQRRNFIHRDLAARNCLVSAANKATLLAADLESVGQRWPSSSSLDDKQQQHRAPSGAPARGAQGNATGPPSALQVGANHKVDLDEVFLNGYQNSQLVVKLADFGMTRDIYAHHYYRLGRREMPVRWMPPECLDGIATSKSDVWSFGVLLWELFSMGQQPYQELANPQVIELLKSRRHAPRPASSSANCLELASSSNYDQPLLVIDGSSGGPPISPAADKRHPQDMAPPPPPPPLEPPLPPPHHNTPHPVYAIMCACWAANQDDRPQFDELANRLYWCTQMPQVLNTPLPQFLGPPPPVGSAARSGAAGSHQLADGQHVYAGCESGLRSASEATTQLTQLNWGPN